jgi:transcriptional regulator with XRE-family HTH domain
MKTQYTLAEVVELLKRAKGEKTQRAFATEVGISNQFLWQILNGQRTPSDVVLRYLGLESGYVRRKTAA